MKQLKPLAGYVLIEPSDEEEITASGLLLPEKAKEKPAKGRVLGIGSSIPEIKLTGEGILNSHLPIPEIKVGDTVVFNRWSGTTLKEGDKEVLLVKFSDLQGVYG